MHNSWRKNCFWGTHFYKLFGRFWILIFHCSLANSVICQTVVTEGDNIEVYTPTVNYVQTHTYRLMFLLYSPVNNPDVVQTGNGYEALKAELPTNLTITFNKEFQVWSQPLLPSWLNYRVKLSKAQQLSLNILYEKRFSGFCLSVCC